MDWKGKNCIRHKIIIYAEVYLGIIKKIEKGNSKVLAVSELKCCKLCGAFLTCEDKKSCCPECQFFDETDNVCLAPDEMKKAKRKPAVVVIEDVGEVEVDPETFLFEDDDDEIDDDDSDDDSSNLLVMDDWD